MKRQARLLVFVFLALCATAVQALAGGEIRLSVAASMTDAFKELNGEFIKEHPGIAILPNFASSGSLAKQIVQGAPADLYVSANKKWMDYLLKEKQVVPETVRIFARNSLVFVGAEDTLVHDLGGVATLSRIAIGSPKSVPAGQYAAQAMQVAGIYEQLEKEHKLVMAKDVRQALLYADRAEVDGAFIYKTDALLARRAVILLTVPAELHDPIAYPLGLTLAGMKNPDAQAFLAYLGTPAAVTILEKYGFTVASSH
ncbi:molybdenum ABC transporter, periplasmic molybdate-binding protein [Desulfocapsa sulfexigens DSM 10523]|uniref:Molybdenum ABC transporter, periplasmic molybdate-binding protein n=1 Tax=Desulfocapsa sulfexigens (strain DSM 10523 / SB164P1) TaxID=1167006 RepID=M1PBG1_DESSD|nr:molybdate ABC transporter substrate-binding protein [Desulfocapsa sulfexigens]AGF77100.1 molybdenum ABC transporter, periplasmic molybdate-binding protein [Desulfocapsa sulfexigens DSM 10523]